jgi:hypothetical protein
MTDARRSQNNNPTHNIKNMGFREDLFYPAYDKNAIFSIFIHHFSML